MAHKKGVGSTDNGRDSISKRLGVKLFGSEHARAGNIIIRQRGTKFHPGRNVGLGKDHTIYALKDGVVRFHKKRKNRTFVSIIPDEDVFAALEREKKTREETSSSDADEQSQNGRKEADAEQTKSEEKKSAGEKSAGEQVEAEDERQEAAPDEKKQDDLKKIGGVGPKTAEVLHASGFDTFEDISAKSPEEIHELLSEQKGSLAHLDTSTWPKQAEFLSADDEEGLDSYLKKLEEEE